MSARDAADDAPAKEVEIVFDGGRAAYIHDDDAAEIMDGLGAVSIHRASHVEAGPDNMWYADLAPVGGPVLGPYRKRQQALDDEAAWLKANHLYCGRCFEGAAEGHDGGTVRED